MAGVNDAVLGVIDSMIAQHVSATPMDLTVNAEVVKLKNAATCEYLVKYENDTFSAFSQNPQVVYSVGEKVYVLVPQGNFSSKKIIIGRSSAQDNLSYTEMYEATNFFIPWGPNWVDDDWYGMDHTELGICAAPRNARNSLDRSKNANYTDYGFSRWPYARNDYNIKVYGKDVGSDTPPTNHHFAEDRDPTWYPTPGRLQEADKMVQQWSNSGLTWIGVKVKFRTEFLSEHTHGKYGIRLEYLTQNNAYVKYPYEDEPETPNEPEYIVKTLEMSFDSFTGNPYAYVVDTEQVAYFEVPQGVVRGLNRVCLFQNDENDGMSDEQINQYDMEMDFMPVYDEHGDLKFYPENRVNDRNNIFASEVDIRWYEKINLLDSMFRVHITSERGNRVFNETGDHPGVRSVVLKAHLYYGGKDILNEDDYEVYWYRECPDFRSASWPGSQKDLHNNYLSDYMPNGWAPIFRPDNVPKDPSEEGYAPFGMFVSEFQPFRVNQYAQFVPEEEAVLVDEANWPPKNPDGTFNKNDVTSVHEAENYRLVSYRELEVPRDKVPWQWYYSCAIVQKRKAEVTDNSGNVISEDNDRATVYRYEPSFGVQGYLVIRNDSLYDLELSDVVSRSEGFGQQDYLYIIDKNDLNKKAKPVWPNNPWYGNWWYSHDGKYMHPFQDQTKNLLGGKATDGLVEITPFEEEAWCEFIVGAIDPKVVDRLGVDGVSSKLGSNREMVVGVLHKTIGSPEAGDISVAWEGQRHFIYNYDGTAKKWYTQEGFSIRPIVKLLHNTGARLRYIFYGPEGIDDANIIKRIQDYNESSATGHSPEIASMLQNIYAETMDNNLYGFHFGVKQRYTETDANGANSIYMRVLAMNGEYWDFECKITFDKDGLGSNGTGWDVEVFPCITPQDIIDNGKMNMAYTEPKLFQAPLVLRGDYFGRWTEQKIGSQPKFPLTVVPKISKGGPGTGIRPDKEYDITTENSMITSFFDFEPSLGYWAETYWDVRWPSTTGCGLYYNSLLRLYKIGSDSPYSVDDWEQDITATSISGKAIPAPRGLKTYPGVCAYTHTGQTGKGAIKVRWNDDLPFSPSEIAAENFSPVICAQTVIYKNCTSGDGKDAKIDPQSPEKTMITTIWNYYPVDIFLQTGDGPDPIDPTKQFEFDPRCVDLNWPRQVLFSGSGSDPDCDQPKEGLCFYYGKTERETKEGYKEKVWAGSAGKHNFPWYPAVPFTDNIQTSFSAGEPVEYDDTHQQKVAKLRWQQLFTTKEKDGTIKSETLQWLNENYVSPQLIQPTSYWQSVLTTDYMGTVAGPNGEKTDPFNGLGIYFRTQAFSMSRYSNNGVNVWDGRGISIDHDTNTICAPTVAAGYKSALSNDFSGVIMGIDQNMRKDGVYGKQSGNRDFDITDRSADNRQYLNSELFQMYEKENPYLAGVYGYQRGVVSFGLMENGTAFFGRADGGAQIMLDGSNGTIYGGGNGLVGSPSITDDMWNCMRINLVDLTRDADKRRTMPAGGDGTVPEGQSSYTSMPNRLPAEFDEEGIKSCSLEGEEVGSSRLDYNTYFSGVGGIGERNHNKFPWWYAEIWRNAYIKDDGELPWFVTPENGHKTVNDLQDATYRGDNQWSQGHINYWEDETALTEAKQIAHEKSTLEDQKKNNESQLKTLQRSTFHYGRASTTPAIEIGQHPSGLMPGILDWCRSSDVLRSIYVPGDRNFMVTYDGTLWAMNGVFLGNIIGSNIIGGRLQGAELGVGCTTDRAPYKFQDITDCEWAPLMAPGWEWIDDPLTSGVEIAGDKTNTPSFYVDYQGNVSCSSIRIFGGSIDIGTFHIVGQDPNAQAESDTSYGQLIQFGESDFVGLVHCYGNLGIGPNMNKDVDCGSNYGHLTQVKGQVLLGIAYNENEGTTIHEQVAEALGMTRDGGRNSNKIGTYIGTEIGTGSAVEEVAFFGIDARDIPRAESGDEDKYQGHWWPMTYKYYPKKILESTGLSWKAENHMPAWFTVMDAFKSDAGAVPAACNGQDDSAVSEGGNYFRVSPYGTEARFIFLLKEWQDEDKQVRPTKDNAYGYIGTTERKGNKEGNATTWAIGISSWGRSPIIFNSDEALAGRCQYQCEFNAGPIKTEEREDYDHVPSANTYSSLILGYYNDPDSLQNGRVKGTAVEGSICFTCPEKPSGDQTAGYMDPSPSDKVKGGIMIKPWGKGDGKDGWWGWVCKGKPLHLFQGDKDNAAETNEIYMEDDKFGISAAGEFWINIKKSAHTKGDGQPGLFFSETETKIGGKGGHIKMGEKEISFEGSYAEEDNQKNIYARFA